MPWPGWRDEAIPTMRRTGEHRRHGEASTRPGVPGVTPGERALRRRLQRRALEQSPILARRELAFYDFIRRLLTEREFVDAIELGFIEPIIAELLSDEALEPGLLSFRVAMNQTLASSAAMATAELPRAFRPAAFDVLNPLILDAARDRNAIAIARIKAGVRETVRRAGIEALAAGQHPRTAARRIRGVIGLAPNQERAIRNFEDMLRRGDRQALMRQLRDRRFDPTLRKALVKLYSIVQTVIGAGAEVISIAKNATTLDDTMTIAATAPVGAVDEVDLIDATGDDLLLVGDTISMAGDGGTASGAAHFVLVVKPFNMLNSAPDG